MIDRWVAANAIENHPSAWDLVDYETEWVGYTIGQLKELARLAGFGIEIEGIELRTVLDSDIARDTYKETWVKKTHSLDEVYLDLIFDYLQEAGLHPENHVKIT